MAETMSSIREDIKEHAAFLYGGNLTLLVSEQEAWPNTQYRAVLIRNESNGRDIVAFGYRANNPVRACENLRAYLMREVARRMDDEKAKIGNSRKFAWAEPYESWVEKG